MNVRYSPGVFAEVNSFGEVVLNNRLKDYPQLRKRILEHESVHLKSSTLDDLAADMNPFKHPCLNFEALEFFLHNPRALLLFLSPFSFDEKHGIGVAVVDLVVYLLVGLAAIVFLRLLV